MWHSPGIVASGFCSVILTLEQSAIGGRAMKHLMADSDQILPSQDWIWRGLIRSEGEDSRILFLRLRVWHFQSSISEMIASAILKAEKLRASFAMRVMIVFLVDLSNYGILTPRQSPVINSIMKNNVFHFFATLCCLLPCYGGLGGDSMTVDFRYPDSFEILRGPISFVAGAGHSGSNLTSDPRIVVTASDSSIILSGWNYAGAFSGPAHGDVIYQGQNVTFNGVTVSDADHLITKATINSSTRWLGMSENRLRVSDGRIFINMMDLDYTPDTQLVLDVEVAKPYELPFKINILSTLDNRLQLRAQSIGGTYLWLMATSDIGQTLQPVAALIGQDSFTMFPLFAQNNLQQYFVINRFPMDSPASMLQDGIPDGWKLRHGLNPANRTLASQISADGSKTWLQFYQNEVDSSPDSDISRLRTLISTIPKLSVAETKDIILGTDHVGFSGTWQNRVEIIRESHQMTQQLERLIAFNPSADSLYPGAIVQGRDLPQGILTAITVPRNPLTVTITDLNVPEGTILSATAENPSLSTVTAAIHKLLSGAINEQQPAKISFNQTQVNSIDQAMLKLGASVQWMSGSVSGSFHTATEQSLSRYLVRVVQAYYTVSCDPPSNPVSMFAHGTIFNDVTNYVNMSNPPAYVATVTYGRELWMLVESTAESNLLQATLNASFNAVVVSGQLSLTAEQQSLIEQSSIQVMTLGGSGEAAVTLINGDKVSGLRQYLTAGQNYSKDSPGAVISYSVRYLQDNDIARVSSSADYSINTSHPSPERPTLLRAVVALNTGDDDKDDDTFVSISGFTQTGQSFASIGSYFGHFDDNSSYSYEMTLNGTHYRDEFDTGKLSVDIAPNGNDEWHFSCQLDLYFADDPTRPVMHEAMGMNLNQDRRHGEWFW
jgi:hypothetical protein